MNKWIKNILIWLGIVSCVYYVSAIFIENKEPVSIAQISFSDFYHSVSGNKFRDVVVRDNVAIGTDEEDKQYVCYLGKSSDVLIQQLLQNSTDFDLLPMTNTRMWVNILFSLLPVLLLIGFNFLSMRQLGAGLGGKLQINKAAIRKAESDIKVTFADVAGIDEIKEELLEIVDFMQNREKFIAIGASLPKGILLVGPPGCGKTLIARALAGEANAAFFYVSGSDFVEMFVGVGAARVRSLFSAATEEGKRTGKRVIIFIDEIDAIGRRRGQGYDGGHTERESTLNELLVAMDGFQVDTNTVVVGATNMYSVLDPALVRPGRFDRTLNIPPLDHRGRLEVLQCHNKKIKYVPTIDWEEIAKSTYGFTGADLANLTNEAALHAVKRGREIVTMEDFREAEDVIMVGLKRKHLVFSAQEAEITAYHEAGHALIVIKLQEHDYRVAKVTIAPRGRALGWTLSTPIEMKDSLYRTKKAIFNEMIVCCGGRAAEMLKFGQDGVTTGASSDFQRANSLAREYCYSYMSGKIFALPDFSGVRPTSDKMYYAIEEEICLAVGLAIKEAENLLLKYMELLDVLAKSLLLHETLLWEQIEEIVKTGQILPLVVYKEEESRDPSPTVSLPNLSDAIALKKEDTDDAMISTMSDTSTVLPQEIGTKMLLSVKEDTLMASEIVNVEDKETAHDGDSDDIMVCDHKTDIDKNHQCALCALSRQNDCVTKNGIDDVSAPTALKETILEETVLEETILEEKTMTESHAGTPELLQKTEPQVKSEKSKTAKSKSKNSSDVLDTEE